MNTYKSNRRILDFFFFVYVYEKIYFLSTWEKKKF